MYQRAWKLRELLCVVAVNLTYGSPKGGTDVKGPVILMMSEVSQVLTGGCKMKQQTKQSLRI